MIKKGDNIMAERKPEHVSGGEPRTFSAIKGQGKAGKAPTGPSYSEKPAIAKWPCKKESE